MSDIKLYAELYDNLLTEKEGDYTAKAKSTGTVYNADIARCIVQKRTEYPMGHIYSLRSHQR